MFKKNKAKTKSVRIDTLIGQNTHIQGDLSFEGGLRIDGNIIGSVHAKTDSQSVLTLSELGTIEGDIHVPNLVINGTIIGDVYVSQLVELAPKAKIQGNVYYNMLEMMMGAEVNGQLIRVQEDDNILNIKHEPSQDGEQLQLEKQTNLD
jgi:cytoskeletal protein CcmA (bactofilin family)